MEVNFNEAGELSGFFGDMRGKIISMNQRRPFENIVNKPRYRSQFHALMANRHIAHKFSSLGAAADVPLVSITIGELVELLKTTPTNNPHYMTLVKIAEKEGLFKNEVSLNGWFSGIGNFISRNVSSGLKDVGRVVGQVVKIAAPIVSGVTGIPISNITGVLGKVGDMIGGDIGNTFSAIGNGGQSTQSMNEQFAREDAAAAAAQTAAQNTANAQAQAVYDAQQTDLRARNAQMLATRPAYVPTFRQPTMTLPFTPAQIETVAAYKGVSPEVVKEEIANTKEVAKREASGGFKFTTPVIIGCVAGAAVLGVSVYAIAKK